MTVQEMLVRMDADELISWQAYEREYGPVGDKRADYRAAQITATLKNLPRADGRRATRQVSYEEELLKFESRTPKATEDGPEPEPAWKAHRASMLQWAETDRRAREKKAARGKRKTPTPRPGR